MKSLNSVTVLALAAALVVGVTGCKKTPKNTTFIPGITRGGPTDTAPGGPVRLGNGATGNNTPPGQSISDLGGPKGANLGGTDITGKPIDPTDPRNQIPGSRPPEGTPEDREVLKAETVLFAFDRSNVPPSEVPKVQRVATYLKNQPNEMLRVEGNCDERGTEEYNRSLGERRALAVRELLIAAGVGPERVTTVTYGEDKPADNGHDEAAWSKNRRADFVVLKPGAISTGTQ